MAGDLPLALLPLTPEKRPISLWLWWLGLPATREQKMADVDGEFG